MRVHPPSTVFTECDMRSLCITLKKVDKYKEKDTDWHLHNRYSVLLHD